MSRAVTGETIIVRPTNNVYTALAAIGVLAQIIGLVSLFLRANKDIGGLF